MTHWLDSLNTLQFIIFLVTAFLAIVQLTTLATHVTKGTAASFVPGILTIVGATVLFGTTH